MNGFFNKISLGLVSKVSPIKTPRILLLTHYDIDITESKILSINLPRLRDLKTIEVDFNLSVTSEEIDPLPSLSTITKCINKKCARHICTYISLRDIEHEIPITCNLCNSEFVTRIKIDDLSSDLTETIKELLQEIEVAEFELLLPIVKVAGKTYSENNDDEHKTNENYTNEDKNAGDYCIHNLIKAWCDICTNKNKPQSKPEFSFDVFDLIKPVLYPPLNNNFELPSYSLHKLYDYQRTGVKFLIENKSALLADEMGLGKSIQTIVGLQYLFRTGKVTDAIILCPRALLTDWWKKIKLWAPEFRTIKVRGNKQEREKLWKVSGHIYLTTYETFRQDVSASLGDKNAFDIAKTDFSISVLDEIQKIKNIDTEVSRAARLIESDHKWGLSGTPLENRIDDLITIFSFLKPELLRQYTTINSNQVTPKRIKDAIKPFTLRRLKADVLKELPPKICNVIQLELTENQRLSYEKAKEEGTRELSEKGNSATVQHVLALITKLKQICNIDPKTGESCKLDYLLEVLPDITQKGEKVIIFSQYPEKTLKLIEKRLEDYSPLLYSGNLNDRKRDQIIETFEKSTKHMLLLMSLKTGGLGLTLTKANHIFHYDLWWNPAITAQAEDRAHRIGQEKNVYVNSLLTEGTIEERIQNKINEKKRLFSSVFDDLSDRNISISLSEAELFELFNLKKSK